MPTAKKIAKPLYTEFAKKYGAGCHLITPEVKAALIFDRAVLDFITFGRSRDGNIDTELLASVRLAIRELCEV